MKSIITDVVIRFSGDSGDGMQLAGTLFGESAALAGLSISTFPDFPAEVRAPQGTVAGVSGFQIHFGNQPVKHAGDRCNTFVAMNPAALVAHGKYVAGDATIVIDADNFRAEDCEKVKLDMSSFNTQHIVAAPISQMTLSATEPFSLDRKSALKCRNMLALGIALGMYGLNAEHAKRVLDKKFRTKNEAIANANIAAIEAGINYAENSHLIGEYRTSPHKTLPSGEYRFINGNTAVAWGFIAAAERSGRPLFCGSYPITPATGILEELAKHKALGVRTVQAEDEIAGICTAIGAAFGGSLAVTTTSGPGLALKSEALGLSVMAQLPLVVVDVQRGGPSTGLPTKSEQADLMQALYGRNGDCPVVVLAAKSPADCFDKAYMAAKIAMERMMPVILLTDGNLANGSEPWRIVDTNSLPAINPPIASSESLLKDGRWSECFNERGLFNPYTTDLDFVRPWAIPGAKGLEHRIGGLEKRVNTGEISYAPEDHGAMNKIRHERVMQVQNMMPNAEVVGADSGLLVVSWGSTYGHVSEAVERLLSKGENIAHLHLDMINPLPCGLQDIVYCYDQILVCEQNYGQLVDVLNASIEECEASSFLCDDAQPFTTEELISEFEMYLEDIKAANSNLENLKTMFYGNDELPS